MRANATDKDSAETLTMSSSAHVSFSGGEPHYCALQKGKKNEGSQDNCKQLQKRKGLERRLRAAGSSFMWNELLGSRTLEEMTVIAFPPITSMFLFS